MMAFIRRLLKIEPANMEYLKETARQQRLLARMARNERVDKVFQAVVSEVRK